MIEVLHPGSQTTVQDGGRPGYLDRGIPAAGAQDVRSLRLASLLVGNDLPPPPLDAGGPGDAGLEALLQGPALRFHEERLVAVAGARCEVTIDGLPKPMWTALSVRRGSVLRIGWATHGARMYVAVSGGIDVPPYLGSRATHVRAGLGGLDGRALTAGDRLPLGPARGARRGVAIEPAARTVIEGPWRLRVVPGPQEALFTSASVRRFYASYWTLSPQSDRMGFRLSGPRLEFRPRATYLVRDAGADPSNIVDDVVPMGGIQVAGGVEPIVHGVEHATVGGYAKLATVISPDMSTLGQVRPGERIQFVAVGEEEVEAARRELDCHPSLVVPRETSAA